VSTPSIATPVCSGAEPAHRELGAEVVTGRHFGQGLHGANRIVGDHATEGEQVAAAEHRLRADACLGLAKRWSVDDHRFDVGAGPLGNREGHLHALVGLHIHITSRQAVTDHGHEQAVRTRGHAGDLELPFAVRDRLLTGFLHPNEHRCERLLGTRLDDGAADGAGRDEEDQRGDGEHALSGCRSER
jgi:hypothetical protein